MSVSQILDITGKLSTSVVPDLRVLGYTNEAPGTMTQHVSNTRGRLVLLEGRSALLDLATTNLQSRVTALEAGGSGGVSQADFLNLLQTVNSMSLLIDQLTARLNYADAYLKMIDEAIAIDGFSGWTPPDFQ